MEHPHDGPGRERRQRARKERVLHTRISEELSEDLRRVADELRVPVSNLVRNVLEEAFSVVETVTGNVGDLIEEVVDEAEAAAARLREKRRPGARRSAGAASGPGPEAGGEVLGWQPLLLARPQPCIDCGASLEAGEDAFTSVSARGVGGSYLCPRCFRARTAR